MRLLLHTTYRLLPENIADGRGLNNRLTTTYILSFISRFAQRQVKIQWENCSPQGINHPELSLPSSSIRILNPTQEFPGEFTAGVMKNIQTEKRKKKRLTKFTIATGYNTPHLGEINVKERILPPLQT